MANIFNSHKLSKLFIYPLVIGATLTCSIPQPLYSQQVNVFDQVGLMIRLEKIVEKLLKQEKKGNVDTMIDLLLDVKQEVETATGNAISIETNLARVQNEMTQKGYKMPKKQLESFKKKIKEREKKKKNHARYMAMIIDDPHAVFNHQDEELLFMAKHGHDKEDKEEVRIEVPVKVAFGVTMALCGVFLCVLPIPYAKTWGGELIFSGVLMACDAGMDHMKEQEEKKNKGQ